MTADDDMIPEPVLDQATAWVVRLQDAPDDAAVRAGFEDWLAQSEVNARAWAKTKKAWVQMGQVPAAYAHEWPQRRVARSPRSAAPATGTRRATFPALGALRRRFSGRGLVFGLAACVLLALALPSIQIRIAADYATSVAETREISLEDGSIIHLAPDSAIAVAFSAGARQVRLLRGEVYFEVMPDRARPFSVRAEDLDVTVTGTAFDVGVTGRSFSITVASGTVRVARPGLGGVELASGQGLLIDRTTGEATDTAPSPRSVAAWRTGHLVVENVPLTDVVAAIGRYHRGTIVVTDRGLREKRVTGGYDLRDPNRALRVLAAPYGGVVREFTPWLLVLSAD